MDLAEILEESVLCDKLQMIQFWERSQTGF